MPAAAHRRCPPGPRSAAPVPSGPTPPPSGSAPPAASAARPWQPQPRPTGGVRGSVSSPPPHPRPHPRPPVPYLRPVGAVVPRLGRTRPPRGLRGSRRRRSLGRSAVRRRRLRREREGRGERTGEHRADREAAPEAPPAPHRAALEGVIGVQRRAVGAGPVLHHGGVLQETRPELTPGAHSGPGPEPRGRAGRAPGRGYPGAPRGRRVGPWPHRDRERSRRRVRRASPPRAADWPPPPRRHRRRSGLPRAAPRGALRMRGAGPRAESR